MNIKALITVAALCIGMISGQGAALAESGDWQVRADTQASYGKYNGSIKRKDLVNAGVIMSADYLEKGGFSLGANYTKLTFNAGSVLNQQSIYGSLRYNIYLDALPGPLTLRIDGHGINNNDVTGNTDNVKVIAPQLSFLNYSKTFYIDLGYARSSYQNNLTVDQWTPTLGMGFNDGADWLQVRGYFIKPSNKLRAQNTSRTSAADVKWTHWLAPDAWWGLEKLQLSGLFGDRIYAVDGDVAAVYNLADVQKGSLSLALQWKLSPSLHLMLAAGNERYLDNAINDSYNNRYAYIDLSTQW